MPDQAQTNPTVQATASTPLVPYHTHGGADGPLIPLSHVSGSLPSTNGTPTWSPSGGLNTTLAMDYTNGELWFYANGVWNHTQYLTAPLPPRVVSVTTAASYTVNTDSYDALSITALATTLNTLNASGSPVDFQKLIIRIKDNGSSQTQNWGTAFTDYGGGLPSSTVAGKTMTLGFIYDSAASLWGCVAYVHV